MSGLRPVRSGDWETFWDGLRSGVVLVQGCQACGRQQFPPSTHCRRCGEPGPRWEEPAGEAVVYSHTAVHRPPQQSFADEVPYVVAIAEFESGARLLGRLRGVDPDDVYVGMPVAVVAMDHGDWQSAELRACGEGP